MVFNYRKLVGRIVEYYGSQKAFADKLGLSTTQLSLKLNGNVAWTQNQIYQVSLLLEIPLDEIGIYFFRKEK